jgi:hypothetical protein
MNLIQHVRRHRSRYVLTLICSMVIILSVKGIVDEGIISMNGDMPRHLMNGVFFHDFVRDSAFAHPQEYAYQYFARYPALSLGHHPLLLAVAEAPFYALFGISVFSARMSIVFFMLLASISWFLLVRSIYDETIASYATFLFITTPFIVEFSQLVMTEIPTIALIILTVFFLNKYCETEEKKYAYAFAISLCLSVYSKHIAVFLFPVSLFYLIIKKGPRGLVHREILYISVMIVTLLTPLLLITLKFSHHSIEYVSKAATIKPKADKLSFYANALWKYHITLPVLILSIISFLLSVFRRDKRVIIFVLWMVCLFVMDTYIGWKVPRYAIYWIPVYCLFASTIFIIFDSRFWKIFVSVILIIVAGYQFIVSYQKRLEFAYGYEDAAKYVVDHSTGGNILYSSIMDTGYFIFFLRKHNPPRDLIVLRANKILATSEMHRIVENRTKDRKEIYEMLNNYGVKYVVLEDKKVRHKKARALKWLNEEVRSDKFALLKEIILRSNDPGVNNVPLRIYEYKGYASPNEGQIIRMNIPLMGDSIEIPLHDLLRSE